MQKQSPISQMSHSLTQNEENQQARYIITSVERKFCSMADDYNSNDLLLTIEDRQPERPTEIIARSQDANK